MLEGSVCLLMQKWKFFGDTERNDEYHEKVREELAEHLRAMRACKMPVAPETAALRIKLYMLNGYFEDALDEV
jgi:hypothetical protein